MNVCHGLNAKQDASQELVCSNHVPLRSQPLRAEINVMC